jgi:hypothetical protein
MLEIVIHFNQFHPIRRRCLDMDRFFMMHLKLLVFFFYLKIKMKSTKWLEIHRSYSYRHLFSFQSDSESSSCGDDESHADNISRQSAIPPQISKSISLKINFSKIDFFQ